MDERTRDDGPEGSSYSDHEFLETVRTDGGAESDFDGKIEAFRKLWNLAAESQDLVELVDLEDVSDAVDEEGVIRAIEGGNIPESIEKRDLKEALDLRALLRAIDLETLFDEVDVKRAWRESDEFKDALKAVTSEEWISDAITGGASEDTGADGADGEDGRDGGLAETASDIGEGVKSGLAEAGEDMGSLGTIPDEAYQITIQKKALEGVDAFREGVLEAHEKLRKLHEANRERMRRQYEDKAVNSRNPTAYSTMPTDRGDVGSKATQYSTVPRDTRYSTVSNRERIYGHRFRNR